MDVQQEQKFIRLLKEADSVERKSLEAMLEAFMAGADTRTAIEAANAVRVEAGRKPVLVDEMLAELEGKKEQERSLGCESESAAWAS